MVVVLPAPLSPRSAKMDPLGTSRSRPATAFFLPKCLDKPRISITGSMRAFLRRWRIKGSGPSFAAIGFAIGPGQFFFHKVADLFRRQGAGSCFAEGFADTSAHDLPALASAGVRRFRRDLHASAALRCHDATALQ